MLSLKDGTKLVTENLVGEETVPVTLHTDPRPELHVPLVVLKDPLNEVNAILFDIVAQDLCEPSVVESCMVNTDEVNGLGDMESRVTKGKLVMEDGVPSNPVLRTEDVALNVEVSLP